MYITDMMLSKFPDNTFSCNVTELVSGYLRNQDVKYSYKSHMIIHECDEKHIVFHVIFNDVKVGEVLCNKVSHVWIITDIKLDIDYDISYYIGFKLDFAESWLDGYKK